MKDYPVSLFIDNKAIGHNLFAVEAYSDMQTLNEGGIPLENLYVVEQCCEHASEDAPDCEECRKLLSKLVQKKETNEI